ncbi:MAG: hypothetical protein ABI353_24375 [Isosphaeraceae bacterium]
MLYRRFDWHEHLQGVWGEYGSAQEAVRRFKESVDAKPDLLEKNSPVRKHLRNAHKNLEGTYIVRLFAAFEAALRSFDRSQHKNPKHETDAATMIDQIGGKREHGIDPSIREDAQAVRRVRNFWAHESDIDPGPMTIDEARARLQKYLSELPETW